ncbi:MAG TPA: hypothetical protein VIO43_02180 [Lutibacter sp.]
MKNCAVFFWVLLLGALTLSSCDNTKTEDVFEEVNGNVKEKLIKRVETSDLLQENLIITVNYDGQNRVSSVSDGESSRFFNYGSNGELKLVSGNPNGSALNISDFYLAPYDAFDKGEVLVFDNSGNPTKILAFEDGYNSASLIGDIFYDNKPNPYFYTLKAAKIIDIFDKAELNFGYQNPKIMKARQLLPFNNISGMIFKDSNGITKYEAQFDYDYDADGYPTGAIVTSLDENGSNTFIVKYFYK